MSYLDSITKSLDVQPGGAPTRIYLSQNENGRELYFALAGLENDIPAGSQVTLVGTKPDGLFYSASGAVLDNNVVRIREQLQMTAVAGIWDAKINITNDTNLLATGRIRIIVDPEVSEWEAVPSDSQLDGAIAMAQHFAEVARSDAYGSPLTASTISEMTDESRVYVYTGSETGYTSGHWYYWNGSSWMDGGVYFAAEVETDKYLKELNVPADAYITGYFMDLLSEQTKNLIGMQMLIGDKHLSISGYTVYGLGYYFNEAFGEGTDGILFDRSRIEPNTVYTLSLTVRREKSSIHGNGLKVRLYHTDESYNEVTVPNTQTTDLAVSIRSSSDKTVSAVLLVMLDAETESSNWYISNVQLEKGLERTSYVPDRTFLNVELSNEVAQLRNKLNDISESSNFVYTSDWLSDGANASFVGDNIYLMATETSNGTANAYIEFQTDNFLISYDSKSANSTIEVEVLNASGVVSDDDTVTSSPYGPVNLGSVKTVRVRCYVSSGTTANISKLIIEKDVTTPSEFIRGFSAVDKKLRAEVEDFKTEVEEALDDIVSVEVDDTLTQPGAAADAKKTGDEISSLKEDLNNTTSVSIGAFELQQGSYRITSGLYRSDDIYYCCSKGYVNPNTKLSFSETEEYVVTLLAYDENDNYIGAWQHGEFSTSNSYRKDFVFRALNMKRISALYPKYKFKINIGHYDDSDLTEIQIDDIVDNLIIDNDVKKERDFVYNVIDKFYDNYYIRGDETASKGYNRKDTTSCVTNFIPVYEGMKLCVYGITNGVGSASSTLFAYDSDHTRVGNLIYKEGYRYHYVEGDIVTIPTGVSFVKANFANSYRSLCSITTDREGFEYIKKWKTIPDDAVKIFTGEYAVGDANTKQDANNTLIDSSTTEAPYRISANCAVSLPSGRYSKLLVKLKNNNYAVKILLAEYLDHIEALTNPKTWFFDGDVIDISEYVGTYTNNPIYITWSIGMPIYGKNPGTNTNTARTLTIDDAEDAGLEIYALYKDTDITISNNVRLISAAKMDDYMLNGNDISTSKRRDNNGSVVIFHASDPHGDARRIERMFDLADYIKADAAIVTGDLAMNTIHSGVEWFHDIVKKHKTLPAICIGNHESTGDVSSDDDVYNEIMQPIATELGNSTGKPYYYKDIPNKYIRIISVNLYQISGRGTIGRTHFLNDQLTWLISTLSSTPSNYGVIILEHAAQRSIRQSDPTPNTFYTPVKNRPKQTTGTISEVTGAPIYDLIDAFIGRTIINKTYMQTGTPSSLTVQADFSNIDKSVDFIAFMNGHLHEDTICPIPDTTYKQLALNVTTSNAFYGGSRNPYLNECSDLGRDPFGEAQDAFNVYVINRSKKKIKVVRIGADFTNLQEWRKYMEIDYTNWHEFTPSLTNGTIDNPNNDHAVTTDYIPITAGKVAKCEIAKATAGYYTYGYAIYNNEHTRIFQSAISSLTRYNYVKISEENAAYIRYMVGQYALDYAGLPMTANDFQNGEFKILVSD